MNIKNLLSITVISSAFIISASACSASSIGNAGPNRVVSEGSNAVSSPAASPSNVETAVGIAQASPTPANKPRTVRDFFMELPDRYFTLESCDKANDKGCKKAKVDYLKTLPGIEDTANGYLTGGCDGAQGCLEMAIFKKADGNYIIGVRSDL